MGQREEGHDSMLSRTSTSMLEAASWRKATWASGTNCRGKLTISREGRHVPTIHIRTWSAFPTICGNVACERSATWSTKCMSCHEAWRTRLAAASPSICDMQRREHATMLHCSPQATHSYQELHWPNRSAATWGGLPKLMQRDSLCAVNEDVREPPSPSRPHSEASVATTSGLTLARRSERHTQTKTK